MRFAQFTIQGSFAPVVNIEICEVCGALVGDRDLHASTHATPTADNSRLTSCPSCEAPAIDTGERRWCMVCNDYPGTCIADHCLSCGAST